MREIFQWTPDKIDFLRQHYPQQGKMWCAKHLGVSEGVIRCKAASLRLKQDRTSQFFADWQKRAGMSKIGRKRPEQALVIKRSWASGKIVRHPPEVYAALTVASMLHQKQNGHPRGYAGKKHSPETRLKLGVPVKAWWKTLTKEEKLARSMQMMKTREKNGTWAPPRMNAAWKAGWREIGPIKKFYRSRWEANYARYLQWMQEHGQIKSWSHEPKVFWFERIKRGVRSYLPDFHVVGTDGQEAFHEVKGWFDARSKTAIKRMKIYHPNVALLVIDGKAYKALSKRMMPFIKDWE